MGIPFILDVVMLNDNVGSDSPYLLFPSEQFFLDEVSQIFILAAALVFVLIDQSNSKEVMNIMRNFATEGSLEGGRIDVKDTTSRNQLTSSIHIFSLEGFTGVVPRSSHLINSD